MPRNIITFPPFFNKMYLFDEDYETERIKTPIHRDTTKMCC